MSAIRTECNQRQKDVQSISLASKLLSFVSMHFYWDVSWVTFYAIDKILKLFLLDCRYIASIVQNHVVPDVPYISDAATYSPESCIFGQLINTGCVLRN